MIRNVILIATDSNRYTNSLCQMISQTQHEDDPTLIVILIFSCLLIILFLVVILILILILTLLHILILSLYQTHNVTCTDNASHTVAVKVSTFIIILIVEN